MVRPNNRSNEYVNTATSSQKTCSMALFEAIAAGDVEAVHNALKEGENATDVVCFLFTEF